MQSLSFEYPSTCIQHFLSIYNHTSILLSIEPAIELSESSESNGGSWTWEQFCTPCKVLTPTARVAPQRGQVMKDLAGIGPRFREE